MAPRATSTSSSPARASRAAPPPRGARARGRACLGWSTAPGSRCLQGHICTRQIQSSAGGAFERLGLAPLGGRGSERRTAWTPHGGWLRVPADAAPRYGIRASGPRSDKRELAVATAGVDSSPARRSCACSVTDPRVEGIEVERTDHSRRTAPRAALARGRRRARLDDRLQLRARRGRGLVYFGYWRGVRSPGGEARLWLLESGRRRPSSPTSAERHRGYAVVPDKARLLRFAPTPGARTTACSARSRALRPRRRRRDSPSSSASWRSQKSIASLRGSPSSAIPTCATDPSSGSGAGGRFRAPSRLQVDETRSALLGHGDLEAALARAHAACGVWAPTTCRSSTTPPDGPCGSTRE